MHKDVDRVQIEGVCTSHMLWSSTIPFAEDKLSQTTGDLQLPAFGEGTEGNKVAKNILNFCCRRWTKAPVRPTIDGDELRKQDTASAVERDRSPHPKSLYLQSTDACTPSFFLSILCQNSWCKGSNVLVFGQTQSEEIFVSCLSARRVCRSAILCYHDCCHRILLTCAYSSSRALTTWFCQVAAPKQPCKKLRPKMTKIASRGMGGGGGGGPALNHSALKFRNFVVSWSIELKLAAFKRWWIPFFCSFKFCWNKLSLQKNHPWSCFFCVCVWNRYPCYSCLGQNAILLWI